MGTFDEVDTVQPADRAAWRSWLAEHHDTASGVWAVTWKKTSGRLGVTYDDLVEEALCVGWIDAKGGRVDDERTRLYLAPRRPGGDWSRSNKVRWARLEAEGLVTPAGVAVVEAARADGSWTRLDDVEDLVVPSDLAAAFDQHPPSRERWDGFAPSARRALLLWIVSAKKPETRARRVAETATRAALGERANEKPAR